MNSLTLIPLPYEEDLTNHYEAFCELPGFVLLESSDRQRGRYDVMTAFPYDRLTISRQDSDIPNAWAQLQSRLPQLTSELSLPFQGGAIGYIAYDFGAILAGIYQEPHVANDTPLVDLQFYDWAIVSDHVLKTVTLVATDNSAATEIKKRWQSKKKYTCTFQLKTPFTPLISVEDYTSGFNAIHQALKQGRAYQVNYTQPFLANYQGNAWQLYKTVRYRNKVPFGAFIRHEKEDILSFSPERFLLKENNKLLTSPIKGSAGRSQDPLEDEKLRLALQNSDKNRAENVMIVDLLRNDLGKIAEAGSVNVTALCELQSFRAVHHLVSTIEANCKSSVATVEAFAACFPGGSITGAPKLESMRIIAEQEVYARGVYCGAIAYFSAHGRFDSNIAIRTAIAKPESLYLSAGGGIVIDSTCEEEYNECLTKIAGIVRLVI